MRIFWTTVAILGVLAGGTASSLAQTNDSTSRPLLQTRAIPLAELAIHAPRLWASDSGAREDELKQWVHDFSEWKNWAARWGNRREPSLFSGWRERRPRPNPPAWLFERCSDFEQTGPLVVGCTLLAEWGTDYATAQAATARVAGSLSQEDDHRLTWWEHVHMDMLWPAMQAGASLYGVLGMHVTTAVRGRLQVFVAPGVMMLNVPTRSGARAWKAAANYGIAYSLFDFRFPGNRQAQLHVNLAKAWLLDAGPDVTTKSTDFVGFSMTFKKTR